MLSATNSPVGITKEMQHKRSIRRCECFSACRSFLYWLSFPSAWMGTKTEYALHPLMLPASLCWWLLFPARGRSWLPYSATGIAFFDPIHLQLALLFKRMQAAITGSSGWSHSMDVALCSSCCSDQGEQVGVRQRVCSDACNQCSVIFLGGLKAITWAGSMGKLCLFTPTCFLCLRGRWAVSAGCAPSTVQLRVVLSNREILCWVFNSCFWKSWLESNKSVSIGKKKKKKPELWYLIWQRLCSAGRLLYLIFINPTVASWTQMYSQGQESLITVFSVSSLPHQIIPVTEEIWPLSFALGTWGRSSVCLHCGTFSLRNFARVSNLSWRPTKKRG